MRPASVRAAAKPARGGLPNAMFVQAPVEQLPPELHGLTRLDVIMPWGSLLHAALGQPPAILERMASACQPGATLRVAVNLHAWRPPVPEVTGLPEPDPGWVHDQLTPAYAEAGWQVDGARHLTRAEVEALRSSWARRLASSRRRLDVLELTATRR